MTTKVWAALQRRYCVALAKIVFFEADTATVRLILAWASGLYSACLFWHAFATTGLFERPAYGIVAKVGNEWFWGVVFIIHFAGAHWRILDPKERVWAGLAVNCYGFFIWAYSTICLNLALGMILPSSALEWTMIFASGWALYRTGFKEKVSA